MLWSNAIRRATPAQRIDCIPKTSEPFSPVPDVALGKAFLPGFRSIYFTYLSITQTERSRALLRDARASSWSILGEGGGDSQPSLQQKGSLSPQ